MASKNGKETIYVSPRYEQVWGRTREFLYAHPGSWAEAIHPDDQNFVRAAYSAIASTKTYDAEYRVVRPDGSIRWVHDRGSPVHDNSGEMYRIVGVAEDITERKTAEEALRKAMAMSEAASTA